MKTIPSCMLFVGLLLCLGLSFSPSTAEANAQLEKAIAKVKDFDIRGAIKILEPMKDSSLAPTTQAQVYLYLGLSYLYLRRRSDGIDAFKKALSVNSSINLPAGSPKRIRKAFEEARRNSGGGVGGLGIPPVRRSTLNVPPPTRRETFNPPPLRRETFNPPPPRRETFNPPPPRRETFNPPPPRRDDSMNFGSFNTRKTPPVRREPLRLDPPPGRKLALSGDNDAELKMEENKLKDKKPSGVPIVVTGVIAGAAVLALGGGGVFGFLASQDVQKGLDIATPQTELPALEEQAKGNAMIANILYIGGGVLAATAVVLFFLRPKSKPVKKKSDMLSRRPPAKSIPPAVVLVPSTL